MRDPAEAISAWKSRQRRSLVWSSERRTRGECELIAGTAAGGSGRRASAHPCYNRPTKHFKRARR